MKKKLFTGLILVAAIASVVMYMYLKPISSLADEKPELRISSDSLFVYYENDEASANTKFLNKIMEVQGKIQSIADDSSGYSVTLQSASGMFGVICKFEEGHKLNAGFKTGEEVLIKGMCTGFLMDVVLIRCIAVGN